VKSTWAAGVWASPPKVETGEKPIGTDAQGGGLQPQTAGGHPETAKRVENASRKKMKERTKTKNHDELADRKAIFTGASRRRRHLFSKTSPFADSSFWVATLLPYEFFDVIFRTPRPKK
jgi:hypothetical protein